MRVPDLTIDGNGIRCRWDGDGVVKTERQSDKRRNGFPRPQIRPSKKEVLSEPYSSTIALDPSSSVYHPESFRDI